MCTQKLAIDRGLHKHDYPINVPETTNPLSTTCQFKKKKGFKDIKICLMFKKYQKINNVNVLALKNIVYTKMWVWGSQLEWVRARQFKVQAVRYGCVWVRDDYNSNERSIFRVASLLLLLRHKEGYISTLTNLIQIQLFIILSYEDACMPDTFDAI